jgi:hypothetical protein
MEISQAPHNYRVYPYLFPTLRLLRKDNTRIFTIYNKKVDSWKRNDEDSFAVFCAGRDPIFPNNTLDFFLFEIILVN